MDFQIRKAKPGDEAKIHEAHMRSIREVCVKDHGETEISGWGYRPLSNRWLEPIKTGSVLLVECKDQIYGHAYIKIYDEYQEKRGHIQGLYLAPEALGRGLGWRLGQLMLEAARQQGVKSIHLESTLTAHEFYKRLGFVDTGPMSWIEIAGIPVRYFPMAIELK